MGIAYNPRIVTDGLVLCLDAANPKSYPGSGTTWTDLMKNTNGTLVGGATFSSVNGGVIALNGTNAYIDVPINLSSSDCTIVGAARYVVVGGRTFSAKNNNWLMGHWSSSTVKHYAEGWITDTDGGEQSDTKWRIYTATASHSTDSRSFYVNGKLDTGPSNAGAAGPNGFAIGSYAGTGEFSNSHISFLLVYNKILSNLEIEQNFNALRGRFDI